MRVVLLVVGMMVVGMVTGRRKLKATEQVVPNLYGPRCCKFSR